LAINIYIHRAGLKFQLWRRLLTSHPRDHLAAAAFAYFRSFVIIFSINFNFQASGPRAPEEEEEAEGTRIVSYRIVRILRPLGPPVKSEV